MINEMTLGAAIFADPQKYGSDRENIGVRSAAGGEAVAVSGIGDLPTNMLWLSNLDYLKVHNTQLAHSPRILPDRYLRTQTSSILLENGLSAATLEAKAKFIAKCFTHVMKLATHGSLIKYAPNTSLALGIAKHRDLRHEVLAGELVSASEQAHQTFVACERPDRTQSGTKFISAILPRDEHCKTLTQRLPTGSFIKIPPPRLPLKSARLEFIRNSRPCLCKVVIKRVTDVVNPLLNWAAGAGTSSAGDKNRREWAMSNEVLMLSKYCEIEIDEIFESVSELRAGVVDVPFLNVPEAALSYSYGLLCESLWVSLVITERGLANKNPLSAWIHAHDRMLCLDKALLLRKRGYAVQGYGYGRVTVAVEEASIGRFVRDCHAVGLLPQAGILNERLTIDPTNAFDILTIVNAISNSEMLLKLDAKLLAVVEGMNNAGI